MLVSLLSGVNDVNNYYILYYSNIIILYNIMCTEDVKSDTNVAKTHTRCFAVYSRAQFIYVRARLVIYWIHRFFSYYYYHLSLCMLSSIVQWHFKTFSLNPCTIIILWFIQWPIIRTPNNFICIRMRTYHNIIHTYKLFEI